MCLDFCVWVRLGWVEAVDRGDEQGDRLRLFDQKGVNCESRMFVHDFCVFWASVGWLEMALVDLR